MSVLTPKPGPGELDEWNDTSARHRDQRLAGRVGNQMQVKIVVGSGHLGPVCPVNPCGAR